MANIKILDIAKLRKMTGAGVMNSKEALIEANGDFEKAIEFLRKKGQKIALNLSNRKSSEGVVIGKVNKDSSRGTIITLNCETDFVAKNENFLKLSELLSTFSLNFDSKNDFLNAQFQDMKVIERLVYETSILGEKIEINEFKKISAPFVGFYNHLGNKISALVGLSKKIKNGKQIGKEIAMQVVAMNPIAIDENGIDSSVVKKELDISREVLKREGKPDNIIEHILKGKITKFFKENTLLNQQFINDEKYSVKDYLSSITSDLNIISFFRVNI